MPQISAHPTLRFVNPDGDPADQPLPFRNITQERISSRQTPAAAREAVARENRASVSLAALDPRWVLAVQVYRELQGGNAAVLTPESRKRLLAAGQRMGLRAFDANLVIAIVQDGARSGSDALREDVVARLELVGHARTTLEARRGPSIAAMITIALIAMVLGSIATLAVMRFLA